MFYQYFNEEITVMPNFLQRKYITSIRALAKTEKYENIKKSLNDILNEKVTADIKIKKILANYKDIILDAYINIQSSKSFKYSAIFELHDDIEIKEIVNKITKGNTILNSTIRNVSKINDYKATKLNGAMIFTFLLDGQKIINDVIKKFKTTYSAVVKLWENEIDGNKRKFIEIDVDSVGLYFRMENNDFFGNMIGSIAGYLEQCIGLSLDPIDFFSTLEYIKDMDENGKNKSIAKVSAQKMVLDTGSQAVLDSSESENIVLPILGDLKKIMEVNNELFSKSPKIKQLLDSFISDTELTSHLPWITFIWDDKIKSKKIQVKFDLSDYPYTLLNYYNHKKGRKGMNDVIESILEAYCEIKNNKAWDNNSRVS
ncbi:hypothetical protein ACWN83_09135 [Pseudolactococcus plantarum]|uniref:Uncharacterized protein n=1 Tax=Pseudolactococcus plantarum TaxID=1365 RepID=A0A2A5RWR5_9LACT|nr:hypothetical protein [Lactococcus plantarum]PCS05608.1 hypothetical protein RU87_GL000525 [Lactococcus plantarum]